MREPFLEYFESHPVNVWVMDAGQGTELEKRGVDISGALWSTTPISE